MPILDRSISLAHSFARKHVSLAVLPPPAYNMAALGPTAELIKNFEPLVTGEALAPTELEQKLARRFRLLGTKGLVG